MLDIVRHLPYNINTGKGKPSNTERRTTKQPKEVKGLESTEKRTDCEDAEAMKKLLEALEMAINSGSVEKITLVIRPKRKPKQP